MAAAAPAILGGAGLVSQFFGNQSAQKTANKAQAGQQQLIDRQVRAYDQRFNLANQMLSSGAFDPTKAINTANNLSLQQQGVAQNNAAGASRILGYKPGDTGPVRNQDAIAERYRAGREAQNFNIASQLRGQELNAFDPSSSAALNPGIQTYGQQQQNAMAQIAPLGTGLASLAQYFQKPAGNSFSQFGSLTDAVRRGSITGPDRNNPFYR